METCMIHLLTSALRDVAPMPGDVKSYDTKRLQNVQVHAGQQCERYKRQVRNKSLTCSGILISHEVARRNASYSVDFSLDR